MHFSPSLSIKISTSSLHTTGKARDISSVLMQGYINYPAICHNLVHRDLDCLSFPRCTLVHYINDIMLMGPNEQTKKNYSITVETFVCQKVRFNPTKFSLYTSVKFRNPHGACQERQVVISDSPTTKNERQCLIGPLLTQEKILI